MSTKLPSRRNVLLFGMCCLPLITIIDCSREVFPDVRTVPNLSRNGKCVKPKTRPNSIEGFNHLVPSLVELCYYAARFLILTGISSYQDVNQIGNRLELRLHALHSRMQPTVPNLCYWLDQFPCRSTVILDNTAINCLDGEIDSAFERHAISLP